MFARALRGAGGRAVDDETRAKHVLASWTVGCATPFQWWMTGGPGGYFPGILDCFYWVSDLDLRWWFYGVVIFSSAVCCPFEWVRFFWFLLLSSARRGCLAMGRHLCFSNWLRAWPSEGDNLQ